MAEGLADLIFSQTRPDLLFPPNRDNPATNRSTNSARQRESEAPNPQSLSDFTGGYIDAILANLSASGERPHSRNRSRAARNSGDGEEELGLLESGLLGGGQRDVWDGTFFYNNFEVGCYSVCAARFGV